MERTAQCICGQLQITVAGEPKLCLACNCSNCQRRTGSAFGVSAYFDNDAVINKTGDAGEYSGSGDSGHSITTAFCRNCGSTVHWQAEFFQGLTGIAVGCFADPDFPEPSAAAWTRTKHHWVTFPDHWHTMVQQEDSR